MKAIIICGDSIAAGRGEAPNIGWAGRLKNDFEVKGSHHCLFNLGFQGYTSTDLLKRFENEIKVRVKYKRPGDKFIVMIAIGLNDARGVGSIEKVQVNLLKFKNNILKLIKIAKKYSKNIVVVGLTPVDESLTNPFENTYFINNRIEEYDKFLETISKQQKVDYINIFNQFIKLKYQKLLSDGVHPNTKGYIVIYKIIKDFLLKRKLI